VNDGENNVTTSQDGTYAEVSLRAVELLAKAQRAADEAVAEAQAYARDLEKSARDQYKQILQRAQSAAQQVATAEGARGDQAAGGGAGSVDAQQLAYVRTYARVAHTQLKSVLAALNEELDQLAAMADGSGGSTSLPGLPPAPHEAPGPYGTQEPWTPAAPEPTPGVTGSSWQPTDQPTSGQTFTDTNGATVWPPIATPASSISYFHRGSSWEGQQF
jgi:vacuolar-type H+-ATPase subunit H